MKLRGFRAISQSFALIPRDMSLASPTISLSLPLSHFLVQRDETRLDETRHASTAGVTHFHSIIVRSCSRFGKFAPAKSRSNLSLSLSRRRAQSESIDRSIHLEYRTNRNIGKGSGWMENWLSESWTDFPLCIYSLFLSPLAGFSLRFNDRLTESLCLSLSLSLCTEISRFIPPCPVWKIGYIDRVSTFAKLSRNGERVGEREGGLEQRERSRDSLSLFSPSLLPLRPVPTFFSSFSSPRPPLLLFDVSRESLASCRALPNFPPPSYRLIWPGSKPRSTKPSFTE